MTTQTNSGLPHLGWKPDNVNRSAGRYHAAIVPSVRRLAEPNLLPFRGPRLRQGSAGSCAAQAIARIADTSARLQGVEDGELPSPLLIYEQGRCAEFPGVEPSRIVLTDTGLMPGLAIEAVRQGGLVALADYPYADTRVFDRAPPEVLAAAYDARGLNFYGVPEDVTDKVGAVATAMMQGYVPMFGMTVDSAFMRWDGGDAIDTTDLTDPYRGGHAMVVLAVTPTHVIVDNWWDADGAGDGVFVLTHNCFNTRARQIIVCTSTPVVYRS